MANASAESAALLTLAAKESVPLSQTVRARPKKETGGSKAILCAVATGSFVSRYGTVKLLPISVRRAIASRKRDAAKERCRHNRHQQSGHGENSKEAESAGGKDGDSVTECEPNPHGEGILRTDDRDREQHQRGRVHNDGEESRER